MTREEFNDFRFCGNMYCSYIGPSGYIKSKGDIRFWITGVSFDEGLIDLNDPDGESDLVVRCESVTDIKFGE